MRIMLLGPVTVAVGGHRYRLRRSQLRGFLALLALHAGEPVSIDAAIEALWAGRGPHTARTRVQDYVATIRRSFHDWGAPDCVQRGRFGYVLDLPSDCVDALELASGLREARGLTDADKAVARYREVLDLWSGEPLADASGSYVDGARTRLIDQRLGAVETLAELELARGEHATVAAELAPLVAQHPLRERLVGSLMLALHRTGDRAAALSLYRGCRAELADTLGLEPGGELRRLHQAILAADPTLDVAVEGVAPTPRQLPAATATLVGRDHLLHMLDEVAPGGITVISGRGGVGKTALAVTWAHHALDRFPDGQLHLNLHGFSPGEPVAPVTAASRFLRALGVPGQQIPPSGDEAAARLRTELAGRQMLMVLDNAASAAQVRPLFPGDGTVTVLVTSRDRLSGLAATHDARQICLDSLALDDAVDLLDGLLPSGRLTTDQTQELARICGGLPLALRIAAARLRDDPSLSTVDYAALAIDGDPEATLRATFDLSYARLEPESQRLYRLAGLLAPGDFDSTAVAHLANVTVTDAKALLTRLIAAHLIDVGDAGRYTMHDLLRAHALEKLAAQEISAARERYFAWLLAMTRAAVRLIAPEVPVLPGLAADPGWTDAAPALRWLETELHHLLAAVSTAHDAGPAEYAWRLPDALRVFFWHTGRQAEWLDTASKALAAAPDSMASAAAHLNLAWYHFVYGRDEDARDHYGMAARHATRARWAECRISSLNGLARAERDLGLLPAARAHLRASLTLERRLGREPAREGIIHGLLATVHLAAGQPDLALPHAQIAAAASLSDGARAQHLAILADVHLARLDFDAAASTLDTALERFAQLGHRAGQAKCLSGLATAGIERGRYDQAARQLDEAADLARQCGDRGTEATVTHLQARLRLRMGHPAEALALLDRAQSLATIPQLLQLVAAERRQAECCQAFAAPVRGGSTP